MNNDRYDELVAVGELVKENTDMNQKQLLTVRILDGVKYNRTDLYFNFLASVCMQNKISIPIELSDSNNGEALHVFLIGLNGDS